MNAIEVRNLKKYYDKGKVKAVDDISFDVPKGSRFGFLGPNGAGKTTTIRCILGFLNIGAGEITVLGEKISPKKVYPIHTEQSNSFKKHDSDIVIVEENKTYSF